MSSSGPRLTLALLLSLGLTFPLAPAVAAQGAASTAAARTSLQELASLLEPTQYDVDELGLQLAFEDPEYITAWVKETLRYEAYAGLLRGPQGTLVAGAGNALDQSVLLARLLGDAGLDARVVLGELTDADASTLVMSMFEAGPAGLAAGEGAEAADGGGEAADDAQLARLAAAAGTDQATLAAAAKELAAIELQDLDAFHDALAHAQALLAEMDRPLTRVATTDLVTEAKAYAWVEYRLVESDPWVATHPAWPVGVAAPEVAQTRVLTEDVPPELMHHLRIEVTIERKRGDRFETAALMRPWQRPVANLLGHTIVIGNTALGADGATDLAELGAGMADSAFYAPVLNGSLAPGAMAFDLNGVLVPPDAAANAMAGVFQTGAERVGDAIGALGAMGGDEPADEQFVLTAQWIDFVLVAPGGEETRHRRTVFDRRPATARAAGTGELLDESKLLENLISTYTVMTTGGGVSSAYVASQLLEQAEFHLDVMDSLAASRAADADVDEDVALLEALADYVPKDHLTLFAASDAVNGVLRGVAYRAEPAVVALVGTMTPTADASIRSGVDIIANAKRALHLVEGVVHYDVEGAVFAGAWDTVVERDFLASRAQDPVNAAGRVGATELSVLTQADLAGSGLEHVPPHALTAVRNDLSNGYVVMVPATGASGATGAGAGAVAAEDWHYWRVDLATGETLGMDSAGRGAALTEFQVNLIVGLVVNSALAIPGIAQCVGSSASWQCYCDVVVFGVGMSFGGALFSALVKAKWAINTYVIFDVGVVGPVTTAIWSPPVCSAVFGAAGVPARAQAGAACWAA